LPKYLEAFLKIDFVIDKAVEQSSNNISSKKPEKSYDSAKYLINYKVPDH
jgi:hypothetical protein